MKIEDKEDKQRNTFIYIINKFITIYIQEVVWYSTIVQEKYPQQQQSIPHYSTGTARVDLALSERVQQYVMDYSHFLYHFMVFNSYSKPRKMGFILIPIGKIKIVLYTVYLSISSSCCGRISKTIANKATTEVTASNSSAYVLYIVYFQSSMQLQYGSCAKYRQSMYKYPGFGPITHGGATLQCRC